MKKEISGTPIISTLRRLFGDKRDEAGLQQLLDEKRKLIIAKYMSLI